MSERESRWLDRRRFLNRSAASVSTASGPVSRPGRRKSGTESGT
jgi:hypothetical protein